MIRKHFKGYNFVANPATGFTLRWGDDFSQNPYMAPWPELADISISNYCTNGCSYCYRSSNEKGRFMPLKDYTHVLQQLTNEKYGSIFQVALGGGEPLLHPDFNEIIRTTREDYGIIPNYTTCGKFFTPENLEVSRKYCGAVAISWDPYRDNLTIDELSKLGKLLEDNQIRANIHYVISESTLEDATRILSGEYDKYLESFNAVIFLTYKPTGRAPSEDIIRSSQLLQSFLKMVDEPVTHLKIGFDACFVPVLLKNTHTDNEVIDSCECGFFSVYIDENLNVSPCSFCNNEQYSYNLKRSRFKDIWQESFSDYRHYVDDKCKLKCFKCEKTHDCRGQCPFFDELFLCDIV
ncbi:MAG: radical SAM protein [Methanobacterium sp.]|nr:radical SAM protein [Methanobacterium sp.]